MTSRVRWFHSVFQCIQDVLMHLLSASDASYVVLVPQPGLSLLLSFNVLLELEPTIGTLRGRLVQGVQMLDLGGVPTNAAALSHPKSRGPLCGRPSNPAPTVATQATTYGRRISLAPYNDLA